jgi:hypothetical protein
VYIFPTVPYHKITMNKYKVYTHLVTVRHYNILADTPDNAKNLAKSIVKKMSRQNPIIMFERDYVRIKKVERMNND